MRRRATENWSAPNLQRFVILEKLYCSGPVVIAVWTDLATLVSPGGDQGDLASICIIHLYIQSVLETCLSCRGARPICKSECMSSIQGQPFFYFWHRNTVAERVHNKLRKHKWTKQNTEKTLLSICQHMCCHYSKKKNKHTSTLTILNMIKYKNVLQEVVYIWTMVQLFFGF